MIFGCIWNGSSILFPCSPRPASGRVSYLMPVTYTPTYYTPALGYEENHRSEDWWFLIVAQQRISLPPSPHDAAGYEGQIWRASFGAVRGQNWGNKKQHRLTTQQFIDTNTAKQKEPAQNITLWAGFLVPVAGIEPARHRWQWILSPPRLPVPTHRRAKRPPISGLHKLLYRMNRKKAIEKRNFFGEKLARKWCRNSPLFMLKCKLNLCGIVSVVPPMPFCLSKSEST